MEKNIEIYVYITMASILSVCGVLAYQGAITLINLLELYLQALMALQ